MKDTFYFITEYTENEHDILHDLFLKELSDRGYELIYYRKKEYHIPMIREAKTNAPRWAVLDICMDFDINIKAAGFFYKNGIMARECYEQGYEKSYV